MLTATAGLARDKGLRAAVKKRLAAGDPLLTALGGAVEQFAGVFTSMGGLMAERVTDLRDIERRVTARLVGEPEPGVPEPDEPSVLVAEDLAPADTAGLDAAHRGRPGHREGRPHQPHRDHRPPARHPLRGRRRRPVGGPRRHPPAGRRYDGRDHARARRAGGVAAGRRRPRGARGPGPLDRPGRTADGTPVKLLANVADGASAAAAAAGPVEGVGLFRTELCFLNRKDEPSVEEQADIYSGVLGPFGGDRYVVVRTLDAGSDKPIAFATHEGEENPALGVRGLRLSFGNPGLHGAPARGHRRPPPSAPAPRPG